MPMDIWTGPEDRYVPGIKRGSPFEVHAQYC